MRPIVSILLVFFALCCSVKGASCGDVRGGGGFLFASSNDHVDQGLGVDAFLDFLLSDVVTLRAGVGTYGSDTPVDRLSKGDYQLTWVEACIAIQNNEGTVNPYAGVGVGYYVTDHELAPELESAASYYGLRVKEDIEDTAGFNIRGGVQFSLSPRVLLDLEAKYIILNAQLDATVTDIYTFESVTVSEDLELNTLTLGARIGISF